MTTLYIAEKKLIAEAIHDGLGGDFAKKDGYFEKDGIQITWASGHLLELSTEAYKGASLDSLPIKEKNYQKKPTSDKSKYKQFETIKKLLQNADIVVNAGDEDDEGQAIVDSLLRHFKSQAQVKRILISDYSTSSVKKALNNLKDNKVYEYMGYQAEARAIGDLALGMNLSIGATKVAKLNGSDELISVGRVQSAILGLIVRRHRENESHKKQYYYNVVADFNIGNKTFSGLLVLNEQTKIDNNLVSLDDKGRLESRHQAEAIQKKCNMEFASIKSAKTQSKQKEPPLPYNLAELQAECSRKYGYKLEETLNITQALRDNHHAITYNRSDCSYLTDEQYSERHEVLQAISGNGNFDKMVQGADTGIKSRAFNNENVSAHTAIIPTTAKVNLAKMSDKEKNVYNLIVRNYIAQFYPNFEYDSTKIQVECSGYEFTTNANVATKQGFKVLFNKGELDDELDDDDDLRSLKSGETGVCAEAKIQDKETKPKPLYTTDTLIKDLTQSAKYIKDQELAKILQERDKDKKGENGGIGTSATRHSIVEKLYERGYIEDKGKSIISTEKGQKLYDFLPDSLRYPDTTAKWAREFNNIKTQNDLDNFINFVFDDCINVEINRLKENRHSLKFDDNVKQIKCPECGRNAFLKNGKFGKYWGCSGWNDKENPCKWTAKDDKGKPKSGDKAKAEITEYYCQECQSPLRLQTGVSKKTGKPYKFYSCTGFPKCKTTYWEKDGKPDFKN